MTERSERPKSNKEESLTLLALIVASDYVLDSCLERNFDDHETNEVFLIAGQEEVNLLLGRPFSFHGLSMCIFCR